MTTAMTTAATTETPAAGTIDMKLEVVTLPVADVDRAKRFYESLGWRLDSDFVFGDIRGVQLTPPRSNASTTFGTGLTTAVPGSAQRMELVVSDIVAARTRPHPPRRRGERAAPPRRRHHPAGPRPGASLLPDLRLLQRPGRERVAAPGGHVAASGPRVEELTTRGLAGVFDGRDGSPEARRWIAESDPASTHKKE